MKKKVFIFGLIFILSCFVCLMFFVVFPFGYKNYIVNSCDKYGLEYSLVASLIFCESRYKAKVVSNKGAVGLMQVLPTTAENFYEGEEDLGKALLNPKENIEIGCSFLKYLFLKYQDEITVLACYNAGEGVVNRWKGENNKLEKTQIQYKETLNYVQKVQKYKKLYKFWF